MKRTSKSQPKLDNRFFLIVGIIALIVSTIFVIVYSSTHQLPQSIEPTTNDDSSTTKLEPSGEPSTSDTQDSTTPTSPPEESSDTQNIPNQSPIPSPSESTSSSTTKDNYAPMHENNSSSKCLHYEAGRCWDDLEDEAYSAGLYDQQYGRYGTSVYYDDDCDAICQDILDDAYDEGWYDRY